MNGSCKNLLIASIAIVGLLSTTAAGGTVGYEVKLSASEQMLANPNDPMVAHMAAWNTTFGLIAARNMPCFQLKNTSETGNIKTFRMSVGDTSNNFDWARIVNASPGVQVTINQLDGIDDGLRSDVLELQFTNFTPGSFVRLQFDIDPDSTAGFPHPDFRTTLFDINGTDTSNNALIEVEFEGEELEAEVLSDRLVNFQINEPLYANAVFRPYSTMDRVNIFTFGQDSIAQIPEPGTISLLATGTLLLTTALRRRRTALNG